MNKILVKKLILTFTITIFFVFSSSAAPIDSENIKINTFFEDLDPLVDIYVTVEIQAIRSLDKFDLRNLKTLEFVDLFGSPDFFVKVFINNQEFTSKIWHDSKYIYYPDFSVMVDVPDDEEFVDVKIQLWDRNLFKNSLCDISGEGRDVELIYSLKTGHWTGDDELSDPSGYGRLCGCDDGSINKRQKDCELWFNIYQTDPDGDGIPYWTEVNVYETDPIVDNTGEDVDNDGVPIEWEWKWNYDPFVFEDHDNLDIEHDGLDNIEEYKMSQWYSDPYRQDIFIELDQMETGPNGEKNILSVGSQELLNTAFDRYNKVLHIDDGRMGGGEMIPFDDYTTRDELSNIYWNYFLHGDEKNWRKSVFHYGLVLYDGTRCGFAFDRGAFQISSSYIEELYLKPYLLNTREIVYASVYMHELGHTLRIRNPGVDNRDTYFPWQQDWWTYAHYKSAMNYRYVLNLVDYSDGSNGNPDYNDWEQMNLRYFQISW